jgi:glycosyltransferase involved in cell wall biosynthesis
VTFAGRVSAEDKTRLLDRADLLVGTSVREGWGLTVTEAAARGVPSVVYAIPGFRDAVVDGRTGVLVEPRPAELAAGIRSLLDDHPRYARLRKGAWASVRDPSWEPAAGVFEAALTRCVDRGGR